MVHDPLSHLRTAAAGWPPSYPGCRCAISAASQSNARGEKEGMQEGFTLPLSNEGAAVVTVRRKHSPPCGEEQKI